MNIDSNVNISTLYYDHLSTKRANTFQAQNQPTANEATSHANEAEKNPLQIYVE